MGLKAQLKTILCDGSGLTFYRWRTRPAGFYCINYHRIGDPLTTDYDPGLFSCTAETFRAHSEFLQREFDVVSTEELIDLEARGALAGGRYAAITFDDGYRDNYEHAFPVLKALGLPATFFIPTDFIGATRIPWWDEIAWMIRRSTIDTLKMPHWDSSEVVSRDDMGETLRRIIKRLKQRDGVSMDEKLASLRTLTGVTWCSETAPRIFMTDEELREMSDAGMQIGSHTCSHAILSHLDDDQQILEIQRSREKLAALIQKPVRTFAYPVGGASAFTNRTVEHVRNAGYELGFTFMGGINRDLKSSHYELRRIAAEQNYSVAQLKREIAFSNLVL